jgi:hypothetical protein
MELSGNALLATPRSPKVKLSITVHVYNYAHIPAWTLARTQRQVADFFLRAGIQLQWADCTPSSRNDPNPGPCAWTPAPSDLVVKIVPRFDARGEGFRDALFGFAAGSQATIVTERAEEIARSGEATYPLVLGITIAHELGHALLGPNSHSENGIMRPRLRGADFRKAQSTTLTFTSEQAEQMRYNITQRNSLPSEGK